MKKAITYIIIFFCFASLQAQDSTIRLVRKISSDVIDFKVDNLDNLYILTSTDQLKKLNERGDSMAVYNNVARHGKVSYIDVSNPMRVLLYYKDFATIVILDRMLNVRNTIDLRKHNILQVQAIGLSYDNNIWVYDELENKLKKIDEDGNILFTSSDMRQLFDPPPVPNVVYDHDGLVYLYDTLRGVFAFDYYGSLKNKVPLVGWHNFHLVGKSMYGIRSDSLMKYEPATFRELKTFLPPSIRNTQVIHFSPKKIYALRKDSIEIYTIYEP